MKTHEVGANQSFGVGEEPKRPFWAKCGECGHIWIAAYYPMELATIGKVLGKCCCPMCAAPAKKIRIAKQDNGVLQEPTT